MKPPKDRELWLWDGEVRGFGVRASRTRLGVTHTYVLRYAAPGRPGRSRWLTIGHHGAPWRPDPTTGQGRVLTADLARQEAIRLLGARAEGRDPAEARDNVRRIPTLGDFARLDPPGPFLADHVEGKASARDDRGMLERHILPALKKDRLDHIGPLQVTRLHNAMRKTPFAANRVLSLLSTIVNKAILWRVLPPDHVNPCKGIERFPEPKRKRYLTTGERPRVGAALSAFETEGLKAAAERDKWNSASVHVVAALRILMLTGARPDEIVRLRREQLADLVHQDGKTGERAIYFDLHALKIISDLPATPGNPYVFVSRNRGRHLTVTSLSHVWSRVATAAAVPDVRLYDLRHTFASVARRRGLSWADIAALMGHKRIETTQRYAHIDDESVRAASDEVGAEIAAALNGGAEKSD